MISPSICSSIYHAHPSPWLALSQMPAASALLVRGGEVNNGLDATGAAGAVLDLSRTGIRLDGLNSYGVVSALLMNAALGMYSSTPKTSSKENDTIENVARTLFGVFVVATIIAGSYTTIVFSLLGLYSKSAIGLGLDKACMEFLKETRVFREMAFHTFVLSLVSFESSFMLSLFLSLDGPMKWFSIITTGILSLLSWHHWKNIMNIANKLLFHH